MQVVILGAGKPKKNLEPAALKKINYQITSLDWNINSLKNNLNIDNIKFLSGYKSDLIKKKFNKKKIQIIETPDWQKNTILDTFLKNEFKNEPHLILYSDTIFRPKIYEEIVKKNSDIVVAVDSRWKDRFSKRSKQDKKIAEKINTKNFINSKNKLVEFTGLTYFNKNVINYIKKNKKKIKGKNLLDLFSFLYKKKFKFKFFDIKKNWCEFNSPIDLAQFILGDKSNTLERLKPILEKSHIGSQLSFNYGEWIKDKDKILTNIIEKFGHDKIIVRSSSSAEDSWQSSNAGLFKSISNINSLNKKDLTKSIVEVYKSYKSKNLKNKIFIQKQIENVYIYGVVFTKDINTGSNYYKINFEINPENTSSLTSGKSKKEKCVIILKNQKIDFPKYPFLNKLTASIEEIEKKINFSNLDIEFAIDRSGRIHIFQVRPITIKFKNTLNETEFKKLLNQSINRFNKIRKRKNFLNTSKIIFSNMSDWNPAEMIGIRPTELSYDMYRNLITDKIWAKQRFEYGYQKLENTKLMVSFCKQPYIDIFKSLQSFIPQNTKPATTKKILKSYVANLEKNKNFHDKIEFKIAMTCWEPNFKKIVKKRIKITKSEMRLLENNLKKITCNGLMRIDDDMKNLKNLEYKNLDILNSNNSSKNKIIKLLRNCKKYGTLPFAHLARSAFIAVKLIDSLVDLKIITEKRKYELFSNLDSIPKQFENDLSKLNTKELIKKYGHLRPGTYDIKNFAYREKPKFYFKKITLKKYFLTKKSFYLSIIEKNKIKSFLKDLNYPDNNKIFLDQISKAIEFREKAKFEFTKSIDLIFIEIMKLGKKFSLNREELSHLNIKEILNLSDRKKMNNLKKKIILRKYQHGIYQNFLLPSVLVNEVDFKSFEESESIPNFITLKNVVGKIQRLEFKSSAKLNLKNQIILIENADPGYDWIFTHKIKGLVTKYGGANSHMAIRCAENNISAAIGVGEKIYEELKNIKKINLNCKNKNINLIN